MSLWANNSGSIRAIATSKTWAKDFSGDRQYYWTVAWTLISWAFPLYREIITPPCTTFCRNKAWGPDLEKRACTCSRIWRWLDQQRTSTVLGECRSHNMTLINRPKTKFLNDSDFIVHMLYKYSYWFVSVIQLPTTLTVNCSHCQLHLYRPICHSLSLI